MYIPKFPYLGNQVIITSGRVVNHSYDDFIFLFGKKGVSISSPASFTVDANERSIIASPKIELGYQAETNGEPVLLGRSTTVQLGLLIDAIKNLSDALNQLTAETPETAIPGIVQTTTVLSQIAVTVKAQLQSPVCLSTNTFTK
jgi:hypothetical protein